MRNFLPKAAVDKQASIAPTHERDSNDVTENLIEKLTKQRFAASNPKPGIVEQFKMKIQNRLNLPALKNLLPQLTDSMSKEAKTVKHEEQKKANLVTKNAMKLQTKKPKRKFKQAVPSFSAPVHIHKHIQPTTEKKQQAFNNQADFFR